MGAHDPSRPDDAASRIATTPLDPLSVARGTEDAFRRLVHEIAGLIDGSLRYLRLVQRDLESSTTPELPHTNIAYLDVAADALTRVASLIQDSNGVVTRYSSINVGRRLSAGRSLREIFDHAVAVIRPLADEHSVLLEAVLDPSIDHAPPLPLYPVIVNALKNAVEACRAGDRVTIHARVEGDEQGVTHVHAEITDTGAGLAATPDRLFNAGYTTKESGSGLGLAIARDIVHELGGQIDLAPNDSQRGAHLRLRVPVPEPERH